MISLLPRDPGIYVLVLLVRSTISTFIRSLGQINIDKGRYIYLGSARGSGGILARVNRHYIKRKKVRWHIDHLTISSKVHIEGVVYAITQEDLERTLCEKLMELGFMPYIEGFGASDYRAKGYSHLLKPPNMVDVFEVVSRAMSYIGLNPHVVVTSTI